MNKVLRDGKANVLLNPLINRRGRNIFKAFTLAEVLITLGIIGVVAAITLPNLMTAYKARTLRSQFLKSYSIIQQAAKQMETDDITLDPTYYTRTSTLTAFCYVFEQNFRGTTRCWNNKDAPCFNSSKYSYKTLNKKSTFPNWYLDDGQFALPDGTLFMFENSSGNSGVVFVCVDINGVKSQPNVAGVDLFLFQVFEDGIKPMGEEGTAYVGEEFCDINSSSADWRNGMSCTNKAKNDPDYFKRVTKSIK